MSGVGKPNSVPTWALNSDAYSPRRGNKREAEKAFSHMTASSQNKPSVGQCAKFSSEDNLLSSTCDATKRKLDQPTLGIKRTKVSPSKAQAFPSTSKGGDPFEKMSNSIRALYLSKKQTEGRLEKKLALRSKLQDILRGRFPNCKLYIVGSSVNGLGTDDCDLDLCLVLSDLEVDDDGVLSALRIVQGLLSKCRFLNRIGLVCARVPILKFEDTDSGIEVDLNVNNRVGIRNTHLLHSYAKVDDRLPQLVILVKLWARFHNINDAKNNSLSSYSLVLMVIYYLQNGCHPPVLPCLQKEQPEIFSCHLNVSQLKFQDDLPNFMSQNKSPVGELFLGFLNFYTNVFNFSSGAISVRLASTISKFTASQYRSSKNKRAHWKFICIEEPFEHTNTACSVFNEFVFLRLQDVFHESWYKLNKSKKLDAVVKIQGLIPGSDS